MAWTKLGQKHHLVHFKMVTIFSGLISFLWVKLEQLTTVKLEYNPELGSVAHCV